MVKFRVIERIEDNWKNLYPHQFQAKPSIGEYIEMNDEQGIGQIYEVIAIIHPIDPADEAGDLIIRHVDDTTAFRKGL